MKTQRHTIGTRNMLAGKPIVALRHKAMEVSWASSGGRVLTAVTPGAGKGQKTRSKASQSRLKPRALTRPLEGKLQPWHKLQARDRCAPFAGRTEPRRAITPDYRVIAAVTAGLTSFNSNEREQDDA